MLKDAGYQSVLFGKWHLNSKPGDEFDYYKILTGAGKQGFYYNPEFFSSDKGTETMEGYSTDLVTDEALRWLKDTRQDGDEELKNNTVVVYCSDQSYFTGEHGYAEKRLMYEEALKMSLLIRWPEKVKAGTEVQELVQNIDYAPTFLDIAGVNIPSKMQGESFAPLMEGKAADDWRSSIYYHYYDHGRHKVGRHEGVTVISSFTFILMISGSFMIWKKILMKSIMYMEKQVIRRRVIG